jgi:hypothetical protein
MKEYQADESLVDPTIDHLFALANAAEDATSPHINLDKVISAAFATVSAESHPHRSTETDHPRSQEAEPDARSPVSNRTSARLPRFGLPRFRPPLGVLRRPIRQTGLCLRRSISGLFACALYSLILTLFVGFSNQIAVAFITFVAGAVTAAIGYGVGPTLLAARQVMHRTRTHRQLIRDEAQAWRDRTPSHDTTTTTSAYVAELKFTSPGRDMSVSYDCESVFVKELTNEAMAERHSPSLTHLKERQALRHPADDKHGQVIRLVPKSGEFSVDEGTQQDANDTQDTSQRDSA